MAKAMFQFNQLFTDGEVVAYCEQCKDPIYSGEEIINFQTEFLCSDDCLIKHLEAENIIERA